MCATTATVIFEATIDEITTGAESETGNIFGKRRVAVATIAGIKRLECASYGIVLMTAETTARGVIGFGYTGAIVTCFAMADLAQTTVRDCIDKTVRSIGIGYSVGGGVGPGPLHLSTDHGKVSRTMRVVAELAEHILRAPFGCNVSAHVLESSNRLASNLMTGSTLGIIIWL